MRWSYKVLLYVCLAVLLVAMPFMHEIEILASMSEKEDQQIEVQDNEQESGGPKNESAEDTTTSGEVEDDPSSEPVEADEQEEKENITFDQQEQETIDEDKAVKNDKKENNKDTSQQSDKVNKSDETKKSQSPAKDTSKESKGQKNQKNQKEETKSVTPFVGDLNIDIDISPHKKTVESGKAAMYNLVLKTTGSQKIYENATIVVDLPITDYTAFDQDLSELKIAGVEPVYDEDDHTLVYEFNNELKTGQTYETIIKVKTENGLSPHDVELKAEASLEVEDELFSDDAKVTINASGAVNSSKQFLEVKNNDRNLPFPNSNTLWEIKIDIPKKDTGQMYIKEGSQIVITDTLPSGLTYVSMENGPEPTRSGNELTWTLDAPSVEDQQNADDELFSTTLKVLLKVDSGTVDTTQENIIDAEVTFLNDQIINSTAKETITIVDADTANGDITGSWYVPNHFGPSDGSGGVGNSQNRNPNPVVYDDALLKFTHGIAPLTESKHGDFQQYKTSYTIDPNLIFKQLRTPGGFIFRPNATYPTGIPLQVEPVFNIKGKINGVEKLLIEDAETGRIYTRSDLGLEKDDVVSVIYYDFTTAPAGMLNVGVPQYDFEVRPGYVGEVKNVFDVFGVNGAGEYFENQYNSNPLAGPRTAQIAARPEPQPPTATVQVELLDHDEGQIVHGENRMKVNLNNLQSSTIPMTEPLETVVLLPSGVTLNSDPQATYMYADGGVTQGQYEILSDDHNGSGRQLIKVTWNDDRLRIGQTITAELDVTVSDGAPNSLLFDVYGFSGDAELNVPTSSGDSITDTILQTDEDDLNGDGITDQPRLKSGNIYSIRGEYDLQTEKFVKGELDDDWTTLGQTVPGGDIDYQLFLTNTTGKDISTMTLIDVLPSVGDLGITDNVARGSQFTPLMTGPITLPTEWQSKVNVYYSTAKNPKRDDLIRHTKYPDTTTPLTNPEGAEDPNWVTEDAVTDWTSIHSFKVELLDGETWVEGADMALHFSMKAPEAGDVDRELLDKDIDPYERAACNSFSVATDHGQPVEPHQVCAYMNYDIEDPEIEKTVNDQKDPYELIDRDEAFTWEIDYDFGNYTSHWESVSFSDQIDSLLEIIDVTVIDQNGDDVIDHGELTIDHEENLVTFELATKDDGFAYLQDQTYTMIINSKIKDSVTDEQLLEIIEDGGIPNEAELIVDDDPTTSNRVIIVPPEPKGSLNIIKIDKDSEEVLAGAELELRDDNGQLVIAGTTDEDGQLSFTDLPIGSYQLIETKAPEGYRLLRNPIDVEINGENLIVELHVENSKSGWELPSTGGMGTILFYGLGAIIMIGSILFLLKGTMRRGRYERID